MNKTIREATYEEVSNAMKKDAIGHIRHLRKSSLTQDIDGYSGELITYCRFNKSMAERYNLGLEFRLWAANKQRNKRLEQRVSRLVYSENAIFLTLTFNDAFLKRNCSPQTLRRYMSRFLKEQCCDYVANIDFGEDNDRVHYHALVVPKNSSIDFARYREMFDNSNINAKRVRQAERSVTGIGLYINKFTLHALKDNGHYQRLIYSRGC